MSSVSKGRGAPSVAQLGEVLKVGERLRIRECIGVLHSQSVDRAANRYRLLGWVTSQGSSNKENIMTDSLGRRAFLSLSGGAVLLAAGRTGLEAGATNHRDFTKQADDDDAAIFAAARRELLFPTDVAYCNTGTLGGSTRSLPQSDPGVRHVRCHRPSTMMSLWASAPSPLRSMRRPIKNR